MDDTCKSFIKLTTRKRCFFKFEKNDTSNRNFHLSQFVQLEAPSLYELLYRYSSRKDQKVSFSCRKLKTSRTLEWYSFVRFTVDKDNCRGPIKKNRRRGTKQNET